MAPSHPARLGRYTLQHPIGVGGMSELYLARYALAGDVDRTCVVKRLKPELADDPDALALFLDEARINLLLDHPCVAAIFDVGHAEGETWLAMELVDGHDLRWLLEAARRSGRPLPPRLALHVAGEVLRALDHAHSARDADGPLRLVHRDVSPENVLLDRRGAVKLADFGAASSTVSHAQLRPRTAVGKLAYLAPETLKRGATSPLSDLFAVGLILVEMLTGEPLLTATSARMAVAFWRGFDPMVAIPRVISLADGAAVAARALEVEPRRRWPTARHFQREIQEHLLRRGGGSLTDQLGRYVRSLEGTAAESGRVLTAPIDLPSSGGEVGQDAWFGVAAGAVHGPGDRATLRTAMGDAAGQLVCPPGEGWQPAAGIGGALAGDVVRPRSLGVLGLGAALQDLCADGGSQGVSLWLRRQLVMLELSGGAVVRAVRFHPAAGDPLDLRLDPTRASGTDPRTRAVAALRADGLIGAQHERSLLRRELRALLVAPLQWDELWLMPWSCPGTGRGVDLATAMIDAAHDVADDPRLQRLVLAAAHRGLHATAAAAALAGNPDLRAALWRTDRDVLAAVRRGNDLMLLRRRFQADPPALFRSLFSLAQADLVRFEPSRS